MKGAIEMMNMNHTVIQNMIQDLTNSIAYHTDSIENIHDHCECPDPKPIDEKCYHCNLQEVIDDLDCLRTHLEPFAKSTITSIQFVDAEAFRYALDQSGRFKRVNCFPTFTDQNQLYNYAAPIDADGFTIEAVIERYAMDGNGYHVGYESITYQWKLINKHEIGVIGIPYLLSAWVVNPNEYEITNKDLPPEDKPVHDPECEFDDPIEFDNCDCAEFFEGYFHPEDDFFDQEVQSAIEELNYPDAEFNSDKREWTLGDMSYEMDEYQSNKDYAESCNENVGAPFMD